ncbi:hypothetical protein NQ315_002184, partial [Exocentrus adspersus]
FHKVFDQRSNQEDVFDNVAKPVVNSVLQGFNGTIFAYGQTGSGKTYSITGSPKNYNDRGIIPRSIQYVFAQNEKIPIKPTIYISYMEIYNEIGYDLLGPRHDNTSRSLEELPRIVLLEDSNGEVHMRNLSVLAVATEQEAMRLLFLGDTNRTIAETPMNEYSSRSHCIFTMYITFRDEPSNVLRFSKLHLVDLAGSERVSKSLTTGTALREAKHINLSLHFLQQVILALSESNRFHIPYRNSMMTYILKDSLSGNCLTAMLATLSLNKDNIQETISTCRFAQRVSMISTAPVINEIRDPQKEIAFLKNQIEELRKKMSVLSGITTETILDRNQEDACKQQVETYLTSAQEPLKIEPSMAHIQFCFKLLKNKVNSQNLKYEESQSACVRNQKEMETLKDTITKQDDEINALKKIIDEIPENPINPNRTPFGNQLRQTPTYQIDKSKSVDYVKIIQDKRRHSQSLPEFCLDKPEVENEVEKRLLEIFLKHPSNTKDLKYYNQNLQKKLQMAKVHADTIDQCQKNITCIRQQLQTCSNSITKSKLLKELEGQQKIYSKSLDDLKTVKDETLHLQTGLKKAEIKLMRSFRDWLEGQQTTRLSSSCSRTDSGHSSGYDDGMDCYIKSSAKECSCDMEQASTMCCSADYWTNHWDGDLCLGPVCQPLQPHRNPSYSNYPLRCELKSPVYSNNCNLCNNEVSRREEMACRSQLLYHQNPVEVVPRVDHCQSFCLVPNKKKWSSSLVNIVEKPNSACCLTNCYELPINIVDYEEKLDSGTYSESGLVPTTNVEEFYRRSASGSGIYEKKIVNLILVNQILVLRLLGKKSICSRKRTRWSLRSL